MKRSIWAALLACVIALAVAACGSGGARVTTTTVTHQAGPKACLGYETKYGCSAHSPTFGLPPAGGARVAPPTTASTVALNDSVTVSVIPRNSPAVAGYLSGNFPTWGPLVLAFPHAYHVPVAIRDTPVYAALVGRMACLDSEPGDATPDQAGPWAAGERKIGVVPCIYASLKNGMAQVQASLRQWLGAGWRRLVFLWDADWTYSPHLDAGYDATQWTDHYLNLNVDASLATSAFLGVKPGPVVIGGAQHYERYPADAPAKPRRERQTVQGWDTGNGSGRRCERPVRRRSCAITRAHLIYDLQRDQALYRRDSKQLRDELHLPGRIQGLSHRLNNRRGIVNHWL